MDPQRDGGLRKTLCLGGKAFAEAGLTFTEEEQASIDSQLDTIWANNEALLAANGIGRENYRRFYECEAKYEKLLAEYQDGESDKITDAEAKKYMDDLFPHSDAGAANYGCGFRRAA